MYSTKLRNNLIDIAIHCFTTFIFVSIIYLRSGNLKYIIIFFLGSIFIDLDHLIDHFLYFKNKFNLKDFFSSTYLKSGKIYLFLHSWELNFIIFLLGLIFKSEELLILSASLITHLVIDNIRIKKLPPYFLTYRIIKKFDLKIFFPELNPF